MIRDYICWSKSVSLVLTKFNSSNQASTRDSVYNCFIVVECVMFTLWLRPSIIICASFGSVFSGPPFECYGEI